MPETAHKISHQPEQSRILLIIPCYNEADNIGKLLEEIHQLDAHYDTLVIDDGSSDDTHRIASANSRCIKHVANLGIGGAVQTGIKFAYRNGYEFCIQVDGDAQHPPSEVELFLKHYDISPANITIGSRFLFKTGFQSSLMRRFGITTISSVIKLLYNKRVTDPTSGLRLMDRKAMKLFSKKYPYDFPEPISLAVAIEEGLSVTEIPVTMRERGNGTSSIVGLAPLKYMLRVIGYLILHRISRHIK